MAAVSGHNVGSPTDDVEDRYPALPLQQGMIFNGLLDLAAGTDLIQCLIRWPEPLDHAAFDAAWRRAVARHPVLRTGFRMHGADRPIQEVQRDVQLLVDVRDAPPDMASFLAADRARGFDIGKPPLLRLTKFTGPGPFTVVITFHHAVMDGRSWAMLLGEVGDDYRAGRAGRAIDVAPRAPFRDFAAWLDKRGVDREDQQFWDDHLHGIAGPTALPFDRQDGGPPAMEVVALSLTEGETGALREAADAAGVTVNTLVHAAWALTLSAFSGSADVVFGVTRSCRHGSVPGADAMIGMLLATTPLRVTVDRTSRVEDWLRKLRSRAVAARDHQLTPLASIQRYAGVAPRVPLLSSLVLFERQDLATTLARRDPMWAGCACEIYRCPSYPLTLYAFAEPRLSLQLIYDRKRFAPRTAARLAAHVRAALAALTADPGRRLGDLRLTDPAEYARVVRDWNATNRTYPRNSTIPEMFAAQVARTSSAPALFDADAGRWLSYRELDERANRLAHVLHRRGVQVDEPVAVALPRGAELVITVLAILKAGGAYLPLDPAEPPARVATVLGGARVRLMITPRLLATELTADLADAPATAPACPAHALSLAYINYTSGSTGVPKGVAVPHRGVVRLVHEPTFATFGPGETFLHLSATAFDLTTLELWGALLTGGRVVPAPPGPLGARELAALIRQHGVSVLWLTAGLFHQVVESDPSMLTPVDQLLAGGDVLNPAAVHAALTARGGLPLINGYGPTENTTFTTCYPMVTPEQVGDRTPIGRPIQQTTVYVLDTDLRVVPIGAPGELYTGGDGLARGYLDNAALTAARFVPDSFSGSPGARLYRTGDLARWRVDGVLEFLGRTDGQIKIRGFRVEPGEVESVLRTHPGVADAAVVPYGGGDARYLVAYLVPGDARPDTADIADHVRRTLPDYLCPRGYVVLPALPLNANGKIDRGALPAPPGTPATPSPATPSPASAQLAATQMTPAQRRMAGVWRMLLDVPAVRPADDFFTLGGNSLLATRLTFRVHENFGVDLSITDLYGAPTLAGLTSTVERLMAGEDADRQ